MYVIPKNFMFSLYRITKAIIPKKTRYQRLYYKNCKDFSVPSILSKSIYIGPKLPKLP